MLKNIKKQMDLKKQYIMDIKMEINLSKSEFVNSIFSGQQKMQIQPDMYYDVDNIANYQYDMDENEIDQIKRLTENDTKIQISQINVNYINSFDDTWTFEEVPDTETYDIKFIDPDTQSEVTYTNQVFTPKQSSYQIPLQCQTTNQLINFLNKPFSEYTTTINGVDYTVDFITGKVLYYDTFNGKLRFTDNSSGYMILTDPDDNIIKTTYNVHSTMPDRVKISFTNFYYANQLLGFSSSPNVFMNLYGISGQTDYTYSKNTYTITVKLNVSPEIIENQECYGLRQLRADIYFDNDTQNVFELPYFLQLWREVYVLTNLQTQDMIYKKDNINFTDKQTGIITYDLYDENGNVRKQLWNNIYKGYINMPCTHYYVNSVSFNNFVSIKNTYQLQFMRQQQYYTLESLKHLKFTLVDENGVVLPALQQFKVYLQFQGIQEQPEKINTTGMNRVLASMDQQ